MLKICDCGGSGMRGQTFDLSDTKGEILNRVSQSVWLLLASLGLREASIAPLP